ncbi:hypothetical protein [Maritalea sp.]|jgi:hypothetical protein|uniref:Abi-alpha family protein n=1 Tax=Maritalea sp. TaxID=2003361 RepID=UPI0039E4049C
MSGNKDKISLEAGDKGAKLAVEGDVAQQTGGAFGDIFSPITEALGTWGDQVRANRQIRAIQTFKVVKEIAVKQGLDAGSIPPPKFLIPTIEAASLEELEDEELSSMWAGLIVSASTYLSPTHHMFRRTLEEFDIRHVEFLKWLAEFDEELGTFDFAKIGNLAGSWNEVFLSTREPLTFSGVDDEEILYEVKSANAPGLKIVGIEVGTSGSPIWHLKDKFHSWQLPDFEEYSSVHVVEHLKLAGLIKEADGQLKFFISGDDPHIAIAKTYYLSPLGIQFLKASSGLQLSENDATSAEKGTTND